MILDTLRKSLVPLTTRQLAVAAMRSKGLAVADVALRVRLSEQTRVTMKRLERRGLVFKVGGRPAGWWLLPVLGQR